MANYSRQRELILNNLISRYDHPTADAVYDSIKAELPKISLATVYRNLKLLAERGDIISLDMGDGKEHFDGHTAPHYHFMCDKCSQIYDIEMPAIKLTQKAGKYFDGKILRSNTFFYGICKSCEESNSKI